MVLMWAPSVWRKVVKHAGSFRFEQERWSSLMTGDKLSAGGVSWRRQIQDPQVRVALVAAACLLLEAVIAKNVIDAELDFGSQLAAMWIYIVYLLSGPRNRASEIAFMATMILATVAILVVYAV